MKILCLASGAAGHMDFGGGGFVRLAAALAARGARVEWRSNGESQVDRLRAAGFEAGAMPEIAGLTLRPFIPAAEIGRRQETHRSRIETLASFRNRLGDAKPDFILFDRLLVYGGLAADQLAVPYASIGTPGGYWRFDETPALGIVNAHAATAPVAEYAAYGDTVKAALGWPRGELNSAWLRSPLINICFLPKAFYAGVNDDAGAFINHNRPMAPASGVRRLGASFGNQGRREDLLKFLRCVLDNGLTSEPVEVFAGADDDLHQTLGAQFDARRIILHRWVDFETAFSTLGCLAFLGGVGTIWRCIDHAIPMIVLPGLIGDQLENGLRVKALGVGECVESADIAAGPIGDMLEKRLQGGAARDRLLELRSPANYTHKIDDICNRIIEAAAR